MSDAHEETEIPEPTPPAEPEPQGIKDLREAANRANEHKAAANAAQRELAFVKAGVDTDSPLGKLVLTGYDGELTPEAIKSYVGSLGVGGTQQQQISEEEQAATQIRQGLAGGSAPAVPPAPEIIDPFKDGLDTFHESLSKGRSREDASAEFFTRVFDQAAKGNNTVLIEPRP